MEFNLYKNIVDQCVRGGAYSIKLSWRGEPLLHPQIVEMVAYAKQKGMKEVAFLTNGTLLTQELFINLSKSGLDWITISFDGLGEIYEKIRYPAKYKEMINKIKSFREIKKKLHISKPLIKVQTVQSAISDNPSAYYNIFKKLVDKVSYIPDRLEFDEVEHDPNFICPFSWQRLTITWSGKVVQCISDVNELNVLGDLSKISLKEIWRGEKLNYIRKLQRSYKRLQLLPCKVCRRFVNLYRKPYGYKQNKK